MKRIGLFLIANLLITTMLSVVGFVLMNVLGVNARGYGGLLVISLVFGFGGAIVSLLMSKTMAKRSVGAVTIETPRNETETWLIQTVGRLSQNLGIKMPEVAIYDADEMNAFATGAFKNSALVAVSTGLMRKMSRDEVEGVLAHEMSHVNNGDMVTMALLQGLANTFVIFVSRLVAGIAANTLSRNSDDDEGYGGGGFVYFAIYTALQVVFMMLANVVILWFSRSREYHADAGAANLVGSAKMIAALKRLQSPHEEEEPLPKAIEAFGIAGQQKDSLFSTHPSLENRIQALQSRTYSR